MTHGGTTQTTGEAIDFSPYYHSQAHKKGGLGKESKTAHIFYNKISY